MSKNVTVAMILAGGEGKRLGVLTKSKAKPLVLFGGEFRIIDFTISNCINSNISRVSILAQKQACEFNECKMHGENADYHKNNCDIQILTPVDRKKGCYCGTADAIFQNISYIDSIAPQNVIILSGDHIYKMNYNKMMEFHKNMKSHATISAITVPWREASRYGIINVSKDAKIKGFEEKPQNPKSNYVSMGIYIFNWKILRDFLIKDNENKFSAHDFGKNVIPAMLEADCSMWAYEYKGYWKDVGTIQSYWDANMDLLGKNRSFNPFETDWKIYASGAQRKASYIDYSKNVSNSIISDDCRVNGKIINSIIFSGVTIEKDANIVDSIIFPGSRVGRRSRIEKCIIGNNVIVGNNVHIGESNFDEDDSIILSSNISVVGRGSKIVDYSLIGKNVMIDEEVCFTQKIADSEKSNLLYQMV